MADTKTSDFATIAAASLADGDAITVLDISDTTQGATGTLKRLLLSALRSFIGSATATFTNKTFDANASGNSLSNVESADIAAGSKSGADATLITGTAGSSGNLAAWNGDGDLVDGPAPALGSMSGDSDDIAEGSSNLFLSAAEQSKLAGIEAGATADQSDAEIETAYNNQVSVVSQAEAEAGTATSVRRWTAQRVAQAIAALASGGGDLLAANNLSDVGNAPTAFANIKQAASETATGVVELATTAEIDAATDAGRALAVDQFAASRFAAEVVQLLVFDDSEDVATGDGAGDLFFRVPSTMNGMNLVGVAACHQTAGTGTGSDTTDIQVHNVTQAADMLSTPLTVDEDETDSSTAAAAAVIDTANDDVATGDQLRIDVDAVTPTSAPKGLLVELQFRMP